MDQRRFDDLGTPLAEVTFCVVDLETTGGSPVHDRITEVGAVKVRGGECVGTLATLVNPGRSIPPSITVLTGITTNMVAPAPNIESVLPSLCEFIGDAVVVGHNVRFDLGFLNAALERSGRERLGNQRVDTCALARRLVRGEVPNCKLGTLAKRFRLPHQPAHRALDDALATADLLHVLVERATGLGVTGLDDLVDLPTMAGHAQAAKLALTAQLPRSPGVYQFTNGHGETLYVGKATNLRARVRSYFSSDDRRKVGALLRATQGIHHVVCDHPLEAAVREVRLIQSHQPRYNRHPTYPGRYRYLRLAPAAAPPGTHHRFSVVREANDAKGVHLGPLSSASAARRVGLAVASVVRGVAPPGRHRRHDPDLAPGMSVAGDAERPLQVDAYLDALGGDPGVLLAAIGERMAALAGAEDFEAAAALRDAGATLAVALSDQVRLGWLRHGGPMVVELPGTGGVGLEGGLVRSVWGPTGQVRCVDTLVSPAAIEADASHPAGSGGAVPAWLVDEIRVVERWLARHGPHLVVHTGALPPVVVTPSFRARGGRPVAA